MSDERTGLYLRGRTIWQRYCVKGIEYRESTGVECHGGMSPKDQAKAWRKAATKRRARLDEKGADKLGLKPFVGPKAGKLTVGDLLDGLKTNYVTNARRSLSKLPSRLAPLRAAFGDVRAMDLTAADVEAYKARRITEKSTKGRLVARATIDQELAALSTAYRLAQPPIPSAPRIKLFRPNNARQGFVEPPAFEAIVAALPAYLQDAARFAYRSCWRSGEVKTLAWSDVDRAAGLITLRREHSKNGEPRTLRLVGELAAIIDRRWAAREVSTPDGPALAPFVFHYRSGRPLGDFRKAWNDAAAAAGFAGTLFHDLRRSGIRNLINAGVPEKVAMKVSGHETRTVFDRYHIVSTDDVRDALAKVDAYVKAAPASNVVPLRRRAVGGSR